MKEFFMNNSNILFSNKNVQNCKIAIGFEKFEIFARNEIFRPGLRGFKMVPTQFFCYFISYYIHTQLLGRYPLFFSSNVPPYQNEMLNEQ